MSGLGVVGGGVPRPARACLGRLPTAHRPIERRRLNMDTPRYDRDTLVETAMTAAGSTDLGEDSWQEGLGYLLDDFDGPARLNDLGRTVAEADVVGYLTTRLRILEWRRTHPEVADGTITRPDRHRRTAPHRHHHPLRPAGPGPGQPGPADVGGRPARPPARDGHLRHRSPHRGGRGHRLHARPHHPGVHRLPPHGGPAGPGVRPDDRWRLPLDDLPDPVRRTGVQPVADVRGRHGPGLPLAPDLPPAPAEPPRRRPVAAQVAGPPLVPRRAARRVPGRADHPDPPGSGPGDLVHQRAGRAVAPDVERPQFGAPGGRTVQRGHPARARPFGGRPDRRDGAGRSGGGRPVRRVHGRPVHHHRHRLRPTRADLHRRGRNRHAGLPRHPPGRRRWRGQPLHASPTPDSTPTRSASAAAPTRSTSTCRASPSHEPAGPAAPR